MMKYDALSLTWKGTALAVPPEVGNNPGFSPGGYAREHSQFGNGEGSIRRLVAMLLLLANCSSGQIPNQAAATHFVNGLWFDGTRFVRTDFYSLGGLLTHKPDERRSYTEIDLRGGFVVPPYGDAHEHNFDSVQMTPGVTATYLRDGVFYAQGMTDSTTGAAQVVAKGMVNTPATVDVTYAHGGLTGVNGHPKEVYEALANGFYYASTPEQRAQVVASHGREGEAYWEIGNEVDLQAKWPRILAAKPDLIKIYLAGSEHFKAATADDPQLGKGLDPALVPSIVKLAHAAGLKVAAHVDTAFDYHLALAGGVDEMGHLPGYGLNANEVAATFRVSDADVALTAERHVTVQPTAELAAEGDPPAEQLVKRRAIEIDNLSRLKKAGVRIVVGSDRYSSDSLKEADWLHGLGLWTNLEMLRMWAVETPRDIFPKRRIAQLKPGYEASFLVLKANPLENWGAAHEIAGRWKDGQRVEVGAGKP